MSFARFSIISVISTLLLMLRVDSAMAARKSIFMLGNVQQWVDLSYTLNANEFKTSSVTQNYFTEKYAISLDYAVISPRILNGSLALSLDADQYASSGNHTTRSNGNTVGLQYDIKGAVLDKSPMPLTFLLQSQVQEVERTFGGSYTLNSDIYGGTWSLRNRYLPVSVNFVRSTSTTDGLPEDRTAVHSEVGIHAQHFYKISQTSLDIVSSHDDYSFTNTHATDSTSCYDFKLRNTLHWVDRGKSRELNSWARLKEESWTNDSKYFSLDESLVWDLGRALRSGATYNLSRQNSFRGEQNTNAASVWLQHLLYQSLTTNLQGNARRLDMDDGSETEWGGRFALAYRKMLPQGSVLSLQTYKQYSVTERDLTNARISVVDEAHQVSFGQNIPLNKPNYVSGTIVVRNENQSVRLLPYTEGIDYRVVTFGPQAEIEVTGPGLSGAIGDDSLLPNGNRLLVSYVISAADVRFSTDSFGAGGDFSFRGGLLRAFARYDTFSQDTLSDQAGLLGQGLGSQSTYTAGAESRLNKFLISAQYTKSDGTLQQSQYVDGSINYDDTLGNGTVSLYLKNSYHWYDQVGGISRESQDILSAGGTYNCPSFLASRFTLTSNYDRYMASSSSDRLSVTAELHWMFRKLIIALQSRVGFTRTEDNMSHSEHLRLHLVRYF